MSINRVEISGNIGHDPELRVNANGTSVCQFSMCVTDNRKNGNGEWESIPNWVDVTFFGKRAEGIKNNLSKGSLVFVAGRLHQSKWQGKDGKNKTRLEVIGEDIQYSVSGRSNQNEGGLEGVYTEDVPF